MGHQEIGTLTAADLGKTVILRDGPDLIHGELIEISYKRPSTSNQLDRVGLTIRALGVDFRVDNKVGGLVEFADEDTPNGA